MKTLVGLIMAFCMAAFMGCAEWQAMPTGEKVQRGICVALCAVRPLVGEQEAELPACAMAYGIDKGLLRDVLNSGDCIARCLANYSALGGVDLEQCIPAVE
jgi:hypothetical protein